MRMKKGRAAASAAPLAFLKSTNMILSDFGCVSLSCTIWNFLFRTFVHSAAPAVDTAPTTANVPIALRIFLVSITFTSIKAPVESARKKRKGNDFRVGPTKTVARWVPSLIKLLLGGTPSCLAAGFPPASIRFLSIIGIAKSAGPVF